MHSVKKWLIASSFVVGGFILAASVIPYLYKDELLTFLKNNVNKNIKATVGFQDASLTLLSTFPNLGVHIDSLSVTGKDAFEGITLYSAPKTSILVSIPSLIGKNRTPEIVSLRLQQPDINLVILDTASTNYLIIEEDTSTIKEPTWKLKLSRYELLDARISYRDNTMPLHMVLEHLNHYGEGDFTQDIFDLDTRSDAKTLSVEFDGVPYISQASVLLKAIIKVNIPDDKYTFSENQFVLNTLQGAFDGSFQFVEDDIKMNLAFNAPNQKFSNFLSIIPGAYTKSFDKVTNSGSASIMGSIDGLYSEVKKSMPGFHLNIEVKDGYAKYPGMPMDISGANASISLKAVKPDYSDLEVDIPKFNVNVGSNSVSGKLLIKHALAHQNVEGNLNAQVNLASLAQVFPTDALSSLKGLLQSNLAFKARVDDIHKEVYQNIVFDGQASLSDFSYTTPSKPSVFAKLLKLTADPEISTLQAIDLQLGKSDLTAAASLKNPLAVFTLHKEMLMDVKVSSRLLDLNEWMPASDAPVATQPMAPPVIDENVLKKSTILVNGNVQKLAYNQFIFNDVIVDASLAANAMDIRHFSLVMGPSDLHISGQVAGAYDYLFSNGILVGKVNIDSKKLDLNPFMQTEQASQPEPSTTLLVPERTQLKMTASIDDLKYTNLQIKNLQTTLDIRKETASIHEMDADILGGQVKLEGMYSSSNALKPEMSLRLDLLKIPYAQAFSQIDMFKKVAPVASYIQGIFNTTLVMSGPLDKNMSPDLSVLDASGYIETLKGSIQNCKPFLEVASMLGLKTIQQIQLMDTKNWFEIKDGYLELKEFSRKIGEVSTTISGKHGFGKEMDYQLRFMVPRSMLKKNSITQLAESGLSMLEKEASKLGLNIQQGSEILVNVHLSGFLTKPVVEITSISSGEGGIADVTEAAIANKVEAIKDSLERVMARKSKEINDSLSDKASRELEKVKQKAEKEAQKALDSLKVKARTEVINKADSLSKGVIPDSLRKKAREVLDKKSNEEVDKIKNKLKDFNPFKKKGQ